MRRKSIPSDVTLSCRKLTSVPNEGNREKAFMCSKGQKGEELHR